MEDTYIVDGVLFHHGIKGMKWGVRRYQNEDGSLTPAGRARQDYLDAKRESKAANKALRRSGGFGMKGIRSYNAAEKKANKADMNLMVAKAKYKASKSKDSDKAEFKAYAKELRKNGLPGSAYDRNNGGRSERVYNKIASEKGRAYADKVVKNVEKKVIRDFAIATTVAVGSAFVTAYIEANS